MSRQTPHIEVNPDVLRWARVSAGLSIPVLAIKIGTEPAELERWESGLEHPSISRLEKLAAGVRRPLAALLLPNPPKEPVLPHDFRRAALKKHDLSSETLLAIRVCRRMQIVAGELMSGLGIDAKPRIGSATLADDAEKIALTERRRFDVSMDQQLAWKDSGEAFREWRRALEKLNVLVFQQGMPVEEARGFSLPDTKPAAITVNVRDAINARIFTLFHEYAHLLLRKPGICVPDPSPKLDSRAEVEQWCNRFAGAFLIPMAALEAHVGAHPETPRDSVDLKIVLRTARAFKVSTEVVLRRLSITGHVSDAGYRKALARIRKAALPEQPSRGKIYPLQKTLSRKGRLFSTLVIAAAQRGLIPFSDVVDYLGLRLKHLDRLRFVIEV